MLQDGLEKVVSGLTTFSEILKIIELDDDDKLNENSAFKEAVYETREVMEKRSEQENSQEQFVGERENSVFDRADTMDI